MELVLYIVKVKNFLTFKMLCRVFRGSVTNVFLEGIFDRRAAGGVLSNKKASLPWYKSFLCNKILQWYIIQFKLRIQRTIFGPKLLCPSLYQFSKKFHSQKYLFFILVFIFWSFHYRLSSPSQYWWKNEINSWETKSFISLRWKKKLIYSY